MMALVAVAAGCAGPRPPPELSGLWSTGPAACAAGVGIRFGETAIEAVYERQTETLFARPRYAVEDTGDRFRVRIEYAVPAPRQAARRPGARGVLVLSRMADGRIAPSRHALRNDLTGAVRVRFVDDPAISLLTLEPCRPDHPWREGLRGRRPR